MGNVYVHSGYKGSVSLYENILSGCFYSMSALSTRKLLKMLFTTVVCLFCSKLGGWIISLHARASISVGSVLTVFLSTFCM